MSATVETPTPKLTRAFKPNIEATDEKRIWAASVLADLPTVVGFSESGQEVETGVSKDGVLLRRAFYINATPGYRFRVFLLHGATPADLDKAKRWIGSAKLGLFNEDIWEPMTFASGRTGYQMRCFWQWDGSPSMDELRECPFEGCTEQFHAYRNGEFNDVHTSAEAVDTEHYWISLSNYEDEDRWRPYLTFRDDDLPNGPAGLKVLRDAANDYEWLLAEAEKLNAAGGAK